LTKYGGSVRISETKPSVDILHDFDAVAVEYMVDGYGHGGSQMVVIHQGIFAEAA
jgi:hypothetical protein